jgi:hypothetical protein
MEAGNFVVLGLLDLLQNRSDTSFKVIRTDTFESSGHCCADACFAWAAQDFSAAVDWYGVGRDTYCSWVRMLRNLGFSFIAYVEA